VAAAAGLDAGGWQRQPHGSALRWPAGVVALAALLALAAWRCGLFAGLRL